MTGIIFSTEEFSTFNGPGIRMTVFLKGCPLSCSWCHNPEGQRPTVEYRRSLNGCTGCGACIQAAEDTSAGKRLTPESAKACPKGLVQHCGEELSSEDLVGRILQNSAILKEAGGGVTFSGGEPLMQHAFLYGCLIRLEGRVHRAIQTSGYAPPKQFYEILEACDYVLYDLKLMSDKAHRQYCGQSNQWILENYQTLVESGVPFVTRVPLIPGVTDTTENLTALAGFVSHCGVSNLELLPYNRLAGSKYGSLLRVYSPDFDTEAMPSAHTELFIPYGIQVKMI